MYRIRCELCSYQDLPEGMIWHMSHTHSNKVVVRDGSDSMGSLWPIWCKTCYLIVNPRDWTSHSSVHKIKYGNEVNLYRCQICNGVFSNGSVYVTTHSCGEMRRIGIGGSSMPKCGHCKQFSCNTMEEMKQHWLDNHAGRPQETSWYCGPCSRYFQNAWDLEQHPCNGNPSATNTGDAMKKFEDVAKALSKVGKPDPKGEIEMVQCTKCGNKFKEWDKFSDHACQRTKTDVTRIALFVSPDREETTSLKVSASEIGPKAIYYVRGIPKEEPFIEVAKRVGAMIVQTGGGPTPAVRDRTMITRADLVLFFPSKKDTKSDKVEKKTIQVGERSVPSLVYPDRALFQTSQTSETTKASER